MELALSGSLLRSFFKSVGCLSKIGAEVLIEATAGTGLTLKAMNTARSAFCSVTFKQASFEVFNVRTGTVQTAVLAKHLAAALRTQRLERVVISQKPGDAVTMSVLLEVARRPLAAAAPSASIREETPYVGERASAIGTRGASST